MNSVDSFNIYLKIIDRTIEKSRGLQTPEVLEQLKQRWISKLNDLCLGVTKDNKLQSDEEWIKEDYEIFSPKLEGVLPIKIERDSDIQKVPTPILSSKEMKNVNELDSGFEFSQNIMKKPKLDININNNEKNVFNVVNEKNNSRSEDIIFNDNNINNNNNNTEATVVDDSLKEENDDEFGDASWDIVAPSQEVVALENKKEIFNLEDKVDEIDSDKGSDLENVSDLDDEEPECNDVIIGHFERVVRPYTRKKNQKGKWRIKLRNGIAQIANQEIPFETLTGEFEF